MDEEKREETIKSDHNRKKKRFLWIRILIGIVLLLAIGFFGFAVVVREGSSAVILRFGAPRAEITEAGLYFKLPWPFETVTTYDSRLQYLESSDLETTTKDNRNVILKSYALWSVSDPLKFHNSVGSKEIVENYIRDQIFSATNSVLGAYRLTELVSLEKEEIKTSEIQDKIFSAVRTTCEHSYGIDVSNVSILRISLPDTNLVSVFEQMKADRQKEIDAILAEARKEANKITNDADTEYSRIVAEAEIEAANINAETEKQVAEIYAEAQAANLELYKFLRELDTVVQSVSSKTVMVVNADTYPFNVLSDYGDFLTDESDETVVKDLNYILNQMEETDRKALVDAVYQLIREAGDTAK